MTEVVTMTGEMCAQLASSSPGKPETIVQDCPYCGEANEVFENRPVKCTNMFCNQMIQFKPYSNIAKKVGEE
jgi:hypothetical protein